MANYKNINEKLETSAINSNGKVSKRFWIYFIILLISWTVVIGISLYWNIIHSHENVETLAKTQAITSYDKDLLYRRWNSEHGGIYAPVSDKTLPNPYLDVEEKVIITSSGKKLTVINPAFMTRQVYELSSDDFGVIGHMTSLNPINPSNNPDEWELEGLKSFKEGKDEFSSVEIIDGKKYLRLIKPFYVESSCLKCHEHQGYKLGDIRGGISVAVPLNSYSEIVATQTKSLLIGHVSIWLVGSMLLIFGFVKIKKNVNKVEESESRFKILFNSISDLAIAYQKDDSGNFRIVQVNPIAEKKFGLTSGKVLDRKDSKTEHYNKFFADIDNQVNTKTDSSQPYETEYRNQNNEIIPVEFNTEIFQLGGKTTTLAVIRDISERKRREEEISQYIDELHEVKDSLEKNGYEIVKVNCMLEESEKKLLELNANKDKFFSIISHDLKSPFSVLLGSTEMLISEYDEFTEEEKRELIGGLYRSITNVYNLLEGLLEWSRLQIGQLSYNPQQINLYNIGNQIVELISPNALKKGILLQSNIANNEFVYADYQMVNTVLRNLVTNAIKYSEKGGSVKILSEQDKEKVKIIVKDTGVGIKDSDLDKLFRIEIHHTTAGTNNEPGTGVGLILCKELVEKNKGKIWVESEFGKGSRFCFTLPINKNV